MANKRGGFREGSGRKKGEPKIAVPLRLNEKQVQELGGVKSAQSILVNLWEKQIQEKDLKAKSP